MKSPSLRRLRASPFLLAAALWGAIPAQGADILRQELAGTDYDAVREALVEAIEGEGLILGPVSQFGEMLHRTDESLHHGGDIYARAEIFSFCSVAVAARLVRENPDSIADCPLNIALYRLKGAGRTILVYRPKETAASADELVKRIMARTAAQF